jgi:hypothetical protein
MPRTCKAFEDSCVLGRDSLLYGKVSEEPATSIFKAEEANYPDICVERLSKNSKPKIDPATSPRSSYASFDQQMHILSTKYIVT